MAATALIRKSPEASSPGILDKSSLDHSGKRLQSPNRYGCSVEQILSSGRNLISCVALTRFALLLCCWDVIELVEAFHKHTAGLQILFFSEDQGGSLATKGACTKLQVRTLVQCVGLGLDFKT